MRIQHTDTPLPLNWGTLPEFKQAILLADIKIRPYGNLRLKVIVFRRQRNLRAAWKKFRDFDIGPDCPGVCSELSAECTRYGKLGEIEYQYIEVDPRFFAVIGLAADRLRMEVIVHEAVHAAFSYQRRVSKLSHWQHGVEDLPEEAICYPSGHLASEINKLLHDEGIYELSERIEKA